MIAGVASFVAWAGLSLIMLADGRRGLAAGLGLATIAISILAWQNSGVPEAAIVLAAGGAAALRRAGSGPPGWNLMPPGSTARVVLCFGAGVIALWVAAYVTSGGGTPLRFGVLTVIGLAGSRILSSDEPAALMTAVAALALVLAIAPALNGQSPGAPLTAAAGLVAAGSTWLPRKGFHGA